MAIAIQSQGSTHYSTFHSPRNSKRFSGSYKDLNIMIQKEKDDSNQSNNNSTDSHPLNNNNDNDKKNSDNVMKDNISRVRDWNEEYQAVRQIIGHVLNENNMKDGISQFLLKPPWNAGHKLAKEFADAACLYAKIIINEIFLPDEKKASGSIFLLQEDS